MSESAQRLRLTRSSRVMSWLQRLLLIRFNGCVIARARSTTLNHCGLFSTAYCVVSCFSLPLPLALLVKSYDDIVLLARTILLGTCCHLAYSRIRGRPVTFTSSSWYFLYGLNSSKIPRVHCTNKMMRDPIYNSISFRQSWEGIINIINFLFLQILFKKV